MSRRRHQPVISTGVTSMRRQRLSPRRRRAGRPALRVACGWVFAQPARHRPPTPAAPARSRPATRRNPLPRSRPPARRNADPYAPDRRRSRTAPEWRLQSAADTQRADQRSLRAAPHRAPFSRTRDHGVACSSPRCRARQGERLLLAAWPRSRDAAYSRFREIGDVRLGSGQGRASPVSPLVAEAPARLARRRGPRCLATPRSARPCATSVDRDFALCPPTATPPPRTAPGWWGSAGRAPTPPGGRAPSSPHLGSPGKAYARPRGQPRGGPQAWCARLARRRLADAAPAPGGWLSAWSTDHRCGGAGDPG